MDLKTPNESRLTRFSVSERVVHWLVALSFLYTALTGLALWSPRLYWLASVFGGGTTVRGWHPWGGLLFVLVFASMFRNWRSQMSLDRDDRHWLRKAHHYAVHDYAALPEAGRAELSCGGPMSCPGCYANLPCWCIRSRP